MDNSQDTATQPVDGYPGTQQSSRPRVLASSEYEAGRFLEPMRRELEPAGIDLVFADYSSREDLIAAARDVDAIFQGPMALTAEVLRQLPRLKALCAGGIGVDTFDVDAATELGVVVINLPRVFHREVAQHAMALLLALIRQVVPLNNALKSTADDPEAPRFPVLPRHHLYGQTLGLVSFGNVARAMAQYARAFELNVIAFDPYVPAAVAAEHEVRLVPTLDELFRESDFVSVHTPLTKATFHLVGEELFRRMNPSALFVNTSRGPVVDEAALIRALQEGWIAGAGLDVQEKEPPDPNNPLLRMDNVILTPHVASVSDLANVERARWAGIELARVLTGRWPLLGLVNKSVVPRTPLA